MLDCDHNSQSYFFVWRRDLETGGLPAQLVEVRRGAIVESIHRGQVAVVAGNGQMIASVGTPSATTFLRSSAKPFQALPFVLSKAIDRFGFTQAELALACGSHCGEPVHIQHAESMLSRLGLDRSALKCGKHEPFNLEAAKLLCTLGKEPDVLQNNCSGKHIAMLALALYLEAPIETYLEPSHPIQARIAKVVSKFSGVESSQLIVGTDGCGAPVFAMPVQPMALMYARLVNPQRLSHQEMSQACDRIMTAMTNHPELVGGTVERLDTMLMRVTRGSLVSKIGAEGVYTAGVRPSASWPDGLGIAIKIEDGDNLRARPVVVIETLRQLGILNDADLDSFRSLWDLDVLSFSREVVGKVTACFKLGV